MIKKPCEDASGLKTAEEGPLTLWQEDVLSSNQTLLRDSFLIEREFHVLGTLDQDALAHAYSHVVVRYPALRSVVAERNGSPVHTCERADMALAFGWQDHPGRRVLGPDAFTLDGGCALRVELHEGGGPGSATLVVAVNHFFVDGVSFDAILLSLGERYGELTFGRAAPPIRSEPPPWKFAMWQREQAAARAEAVVEGWRTRMSGWSGAAALVAPADPSHSPSTGYRQRQIPDVSLSFVKRTARAFGASPFAVAAYANAAALAELEGAEEVIFRSPFLGRSLSPFRGVVTNSANSLPIRVDTDADIQTGVRRLRQEVLAALPSEFYPFRLVTRQLGTRSVGGLGLGELPFFTIHADGDIAFGDVLLKPLDVDRGETLTPLSIVLELRDSGSAVRAIFDDSRIGATAVESTLARFAACLTDVCRLEESGESPN